MDYDEAIAVLRSWVGREVVVSIVSPARYGPARPYVGRLELRDMWPDADEAENPQTRGAVDFFVVPPSGLTGDVASRNPLTIGLYRSIHNLARWVEPRCALSIGEAPRIDIRLNDQ